MLYILCVTAARFQIIQMSQKSWDTSAIRQKGKSQNGCFKKIKHAKLFEKRTFLTLCFRKIWRALFSWNTNTSNTSVWAFLIISESGIYNSLKCQQWTFLRKWLTSKSRLLFSQLTIFTKSSIKDMCDRVLNTYLIRVVTCFPKCTIIFQ